MADTVRLILDVLAISVILFGAYRGWFSSARKIGEEGALSAAATAAIDKRVSVIERWIEAHQICNRQQIEILSELREGLSFIKGKLEK